MSMTLYLIRHGETDWNRQHRFQGSNDIPLNENGLAVARETAAGMARVGLTFDRIYSSPLSRAYETARILCPQQEIQVDQRLREVSFGDLEGEVYQDVKSLPMPAPGGEDIPELQSRVLSCLEEIMTDPENQGKRILVSAHGGVIRSVMMHLIDLPREEFWRGGVSKNCGMTILDVEGETLTIREENKVFYNTPS